MPASQHEDVPAAKKRRLVTSTTRSRASAADADTVVDAHTTDTLTASPGDSILMEDESERNARRMSVRHKFSDLLTHFDNNPFSMVLVAVKLRRRLPALVPGRMNTQCRSRWITVLDPAIDQTGSRKNKRKWAEEEDAQLKQAVTKHGNSWITVSSLVPGHTNAQCRQRWDRSLDPNIQLAVDQATAHKNKNLWTQKEDRALIAGVKKHGNRWVSVAALIPGRTNTQCVNNDGTGVWTLTWTRRQTVRPHWTHKGRYY
jgi:hypothetical protein